jgi:hypothetical protein
MTSGVRKKEIKKEIIIEAIQAKNGNVTAVANHFSITRERVYHYLRKYPEISQALDEVRNLNEEHDLDVAEFVVRNTLLMKDNPRLRFESAKYILDNKGKRRGWGNTRSDLDIRGLMQDKISEQITIMYHSEVNEE